jgi:hypothetical protein
LKLQAKANVAAEQINKKIFLRFIAIRLIANPANSIEAIVISGRADKHHHPTKGPNQTFILTAIARIIPTTPKFLKSKNARCIQSAITAHPTTAHPNVSMRTKVEN